MGLTGQYKKDIMAEKVSNPVITLIKNGPMRISGNYSISDEKNNMISEGSEVYLCRCGKSANKPYCDGSHKSINIDPGKKEESCD